MVVGLSDSLFVGLSVCFSVCFSVGLFVCILSKASVDLLMGWRVGLEFVGLESICSLIGRSVVGFLVDLAIVVVGLFVMVVDLLVVVVGLVVVFVGLFVIVVVGFFVFIVVSLPCAEAGLLLTSEEVVENFFKDFSPAKHGLEPVRSRLLTEDGLFTVLSLLNEQLRVVVVVVVLIVVLPCSTVLVTVFVAFGLDGSSTCDKK